MTRSLDPFRFALIAVSGWMNRQQLKLISYLREGNRVLREQLGGKRLRFNGDQRRRLAAKAKGLGRRLLQEVTTIVTPETLLGWHRRLIAQKYDGSHQRGRGRPRKSEEMEDLVVRMAKENRSSGYRRIQGALSNLGHKAGRGTIAEMLARHGIEPAPERERKTSWKEFLRQPWEPDRGRGFLHDRSLDTAWPAAVHGAVPDGAVDSQGGDRWHRPESEWVVDNQIGRDQTDVVEGILKGERYLIHDRDPLFTPEFCRRSPTAVWCR